jgi:hypothetical protein
MFETELVKNVLMSGETKKIKMFTVNGQTLAANFYQALAAQMSLFDSMTVEYDQSLQGKAEYLSKTNTMRLGFSSIQYDEQRGMIIHEATHAVCDMLKMSMTIADSETMAYVAQCQFMLANRGDYPLTGTTPEKTALFAAAWTVAKRIQNGEILNNSDYSLVRQAVSQVKKYGIKSLANHAGYDGLIKESSWFW